MPDMSKIGKSNLARSKAHERQVACWLTEWSGVEFRRRRVTGRDHATTTIDGVADVICTRPDFRYCVEYKCGAGFSLDAVLAGGGKTKFDQWWNQTLEDAELCGKEPMLFFRPATGQNWVAVKEVIAVQNNNPTINCGYGYSITIFRVEDFLKCSDPGLYFWEQLP